MTHKNQIGDYLFQSAEDAELASKEYEKVTRLEEKMVDADIELLYKLYNKSIEKKTFRTPIGYDFMRNLKCVLEENPETPGEVLPVPLQTGFSDASKEEIVDKEFSQKLSVNSKSPLLGWSLFTNVVLIIMVLLMFWVVTTGDHPNVINYENAVINKYSEWEQELTERENLLKDAGY